MQERFPRYPVASALDIAAKGLVVVVDETRDQSCRWIRPQVKLLRDHRERISLENLGDVVSTVPEFKVQISGLLDVALTVGEGCPEIGRRRGARAPAVR